MNNDTSPSALIRSGSEPITVETVPGGETIVFAKLNTVLQLLNRLELGCNDALVIRNGELLTPDRRLHPGDRISLRYVISRG